MGLLDRPGLKVLKAQRGPKVSVAFRVKSVPRARKANKVLPVVHRVRRARLARMALSHVMTLPPKDI